MDSEQKAQLLGQHGFRAARTKCVETMCNIKSLYSKGAKALNEDIEAFNDKHDWKVALSEPEVLRFANRTIRNEDQNFPFYYDSVYVIRPGTGDMGRMSYATTKKPDMLKKAKQMLQVRHFYEEVFTECYKAKLAIEEVVGDANQVKTILKTRDHAISGIVEAAVNETGYNWKQLDADATTCKEAAFNSMLFGAIHEPEIANSGKGR